MRLWGWGGVAVVVGGGGARQGESGPGWAAVALNLLSAPRSLPLWRPWLPRAEEGTKQRRQQTDIVSSTLPAASPPVSCWQGWGLCLAENQPLAPDSFTPSTAAWQRHAHLPCCITSLPHKPRSLAGAGPGRPPRTATASTAAPQGPERAACSQAWRAFLRGLAGRLGMSF